MTDTATSATADATTAAQTPADATEVTASTPATDPAATGSDQESGKSDAASESQDEKPKKSGFKERINQITREFRDADRGRQVAEARAAALERDLIEMRQRARQIDPNDYLAQQTHETRRVLKEESLQQERSQIERADSVKAMALAETFHAKIEDAMERIPDLGEKLATFERLPVTPESAEMIADSDKAAEIAYHLAKHPKEAIALAKMSPAMQGREIARLEAKLSAPQKKTTAAPPPPHTKVAAGTPSGSVDPSKMSQAQYEKWRMGGSP
jgi:hypothetical protein